MNLPNKLTVARVIMVPFFVLFLINIPMPHHTVIALFLFALASFTDHLDGRIARKRNLITNFGKFLDPLADKILVISALICFVYLGWTNVWFLIVIVAREFMVSAVRLIAADNGKVIAANVWGKVKTITQMVAILVILILQYLQELMDLHLMPGFQNSQAVFYIIGECFVGLCVFFTILSGIIYLKDNWDLMKNSK
ncbi:MAG: CDP-diacylglycerol--glycerol-3-phosphate 3-phosphatidyltransferase [Oscillospiraceae bacterium]|nr:CDP-diacylglycerol--glycerol-3-phosphate 3-phosphatidyltransferase [Oscillospiraceae bacterium]